MFEALRSHTWAYPALEVVHIIGIALLLGNLVLFELRVFGWGAALDVKPLARMALSLSATGFAIAATSGLIMFASQPAELLSNRAFTLKMVLLLTAACNAAWFHGRDSLTRLDTTAGVQMVISTLLWLAVIACGRWIAYV